MITTTALPTNFDHVVALVNGYFDSAREFYVSIKNKPAADKAEDVLHAIEGLEVALTLLRLSSESFGDAVEGAKRDDYTSLKAKAEATHRAAWQNKDGYKSVLLKAGEGGEWSSHLNSYLRIASQYGFGLNFTQQALIDMIAVNRVKAESDLSSTLEGHNKAGHRDFVLNKPVVDGLRGKINDELLEGVDQFGNLLVTYDIAPEFLLHVPEQELRRQIFIGRSRGFYGLQPFFMEGFRAAQQDAQVRGYRNFAEAKMGEVGMTVESVRQFFAECKEMLFKAGAAEVDRWKAAHGLDHFYGSDWAYVQNKQQEALGGEDGEQFEDYCELQTAIDALVSFMNEILGLKVERVEIGTHTPKAIVLRVEQNGKISHMILDLLVREGKDATDSAHSLHLDGPVAYVFMRLSELENGTVPVSLENFRTLLHEVIGHTVLQYMMLASSERSFADRFFSFHFNTIDLEIIPSFAEHWVSHPDILKHLKNAEGKSMPESLILSVEAMEKVGKAVLWSQQTVIAEAIFDLFAVDVDEEITPELIMNVIDRAEALFPYERMPFSPITFLYMILHIFDAQYGPLYFAYIMAMIRSYGLYDVFLTEGVSAVIALASQGVQGDYKAQIEALTVRVNWNAFAASLLVQQNVETGAAAAE